MKIERSKIRTYSIVENGLISKKNLGEGRMIPALVIDVEDNHNIIELLKVHESITAGDVEMNWTQDLFNRKDLILKMNFSKPMNIEFGIRFNIVNDCMLIDGIIQSKGFYMRAGKIGEKVSQVSENIILIEVPDMSMKPIWNQMMQKTLSEKYKSKGFSKSEAKIIAKQHIESIREFWKIRRVN